MHAEKSAADEEISLARCVTYRNTVKQCIPVVQSIICMPDEHCVESATH
jgi:hypothetical protein